MTRKGLETVFKRLLSQHGPQCWWPGESAFEVMVGAILTQNTAWINVERAIANLKRAKLLAAYEIVQCPHPRLAKLLRPSGYFNVKAERLRHFCAWYVSAGGYECLKYWSTSRLREALLTVRGIGAETADDIVLYGFHRPVFVIDAYTRRLFSRLGYVDGNESYEALRLAFERPLGKDVRLYNEYHALIVRHTKEVCQPKPRCDVCGLKDVCKAAQLT